MTVLRPQKSWRGQTSRLALVLAASFSTTAGTAFAIDDPPAMIRDDFESPKIIWSEEQTDATITPIVHDRTTRAAHDGRFSERISFKAGVGSSLYYSYELPNVPVSKDLKISLFVRGNRPGTQIFARVILPADLDPETREPSYLLVPGTMYENTDHWQKVELVEPQTAIERQARVLRATTKRPVSLDGAYVEQLVLNLYSGAGDTEVFIDELSFGPVPPELIKDKPSEMPAEKPAAEAAPAVTPPPSTASKAPLPLYRLDRNTLKRRGDDGLYHESVFTAIHAPGADVAKLRAAGFDVLIDPVDADRKRTAEAVSRGLALMPVLGRDSEGDLPEAEQVAAVLRAYPFQDSVMAWCLGDRLGRASNPKSRLEELERARAIVTKIRGLPANVSKLTTGTIEDDFAGYARAPQNLSMLGVRPSSWGGSMSAMDSYRYLRQRRDLTLKKNAGALYWAMIPATPNPAITAATWGTDPPPAGMSPVVQPEQLRIMTYAALGAGYRGIAYRGDADLTSEGGLGRMLLLEMSLLNAEIDLSESIIANGADPIPEYFTYPPDPPAIPPSGSNRNQKLQTQKEFTPLPGLLAHGVGIGLRRGVLLFVSEYGGGAQFQPGQMARNDVKLTVIAPEGAQGFEISPGRFRVLEREAGIGGVSFMLPEFDSTALVLVTTDIEMAQRVEAVIRSIRPKAAQMAIEQAEIKLGWVNEVSGRLAADGHPLIPVKMQLERSKTGGPLSTDQADLIKLAQDNIKVAREALDREDYSTAWSEARRASRPLRVIMRGFFDNAKLDMIEANTQPEDLANATLIESGRVQPVGPRTEIPEVASAPLVSFNTLPQHYVWVESMRTGYFGRNLVPTGDFEDAKLLADAGWSNQSYQHEGVVSQVKTIVDPGNKEKRILKMSVDPSDQALLDTLPPFLDFPAAAIRTPPIPMKAGQFFRITVYVQRTMSTIAGAGGIIIRDSIGGEPLQYSTPGAFPAKTRIVLYRRAPADGEMSVTLGLAGYGDVYFDDLSIQRIESAAPAVIPDDMARLPRPSRPSTTTPATARGVSGGGRSSR